MEKFGVVLDDEKTKTAGSQKNCPQCGTELPNSSVAHCVNCGTKPWEKVPESQK